VPFDSIAFDIDAFDEALSVRHTFGETQVYERPKTLDGTRISKVVGALHSYTVGADDETLFDADILLADTSQQTVKITHEACSGGALVVTGGAVVGTPVYNTYSTVFVVTPVTTTIHGELTAKRVEIGERRFEETYLASGETAEFTCPIASDPTLTTAMFDHYAAVAATTRFEFSMRDDPAIEVGDRRYIQLMSARAYGSWGYVLGEATCVVSDTLLIWNTEWDTVLPVVVTSIKRRFDGGVDADYTVAVDINP